MYEQGHLVKKIMTNPHTEQLSELIITDFNNKVNYVLAILDHSLFSE
jgi:hypothetical protein